MNKEQFFDTVSRWIKKDIERMLTSIPARDGQDGNINFPLALCVLVYMENLGSYLLGKKVGFEPHIRVYIQQCFKSPERYDPLLLRDLFRNGLAHEYFPGGGISRRNNDPPMYRALYEGQEIVVLDAEKLANDFLSSLDSFFQNLNDDNYDSRSAEIENKRKIFLKSHEDSIKQLPALDEMPTPLQLSANASHYPTSGASTIRGPVTLIPWDVLGKTSSTTSDSENPGKNTTTLLPK